MTAEQAIDILDKASGTYSGTRAEHVTICDAVKLLRELHAPKPEEKKEAPKE